MISKKDEEGIEAWKDDTKSDRFVFRAVRQCVVLWMWHEMR